MLANLATICRSTVLILGLTHSAMPSDVTLFQAAKSKATTAEAKKNWLDADNAYLEALSHAEGNKEFLSEAALSGAINLERLLATNPVDFPNQHRKRLIQWYELAKEHGSENQKALACNNLGVFYVKEKEYVKAIDAFRQMEASEQVNAVYNFNFARAYSLADMPMDAVRQYSQSLKKAPNFERAASDVRELIAKREGRVQLTCELLEGLLPKETGTATVEAAPYAIGRLLYSLATLVQAERGSEALFPYIVRYLVRSNVNSQRISEVDWPELKKIENESLTKPLQEVHAMFHASLTKGKTEIALPGRIERFPECRAFVNRGEISPNELARLLKLSGDGFAFSANPIYESEARARDVESKLSAARESLLRYTCAYALDDKYADAALQAVNLFVGEIGEQIDPDHALLNAFEQSVFDSKSSLFATASTQDELIALSLLHVVLGTIYEKRPGQSGLARSARFQWEHAIRAESRIRQFHDRLYPQSTVLRQHLAQAYLTEGMTDLALKVSEEAMNLILDAGQSKAAEQYFAELTADDSKWGMPASERGRLKVIVQNSRQLRPLGEVRQPIPMTLIGMHETKSKELELYAATAGRNGLVIRSNVSKEGQTSNVEQFPVTENAILCSFDGGKYLFTGSKEFDAWAPMNWNPEPIVNRVGNQVRLDVSRDGKYTAAWTSANISVWGLNQSIPLLERGIKFVSFTGWSREGDQLAILDQAGLSIVDVSSNKNLFGPISIGPTLATCFQPVTDMLVTATAEGRLDFRRATTGSLLHSLHPTGGSIDALAISSNSRKLVAYSRRDANLRVLDVRSGREFVRVPQYGTPLAAIFSPDDQWLIVSYYSSNQKGIVKIWDISKLIEP